MHLTPCEHMAQLLSEINFAKVSATNLREADATSRYLEDDEDGGDNDIDAGEYLLSASDYLSYNVQKWQ